MKKKIENNPFNVFDEIYIDDSNGEGQYLYIDKKKISLLYFSCNIRRL